MCLNMFDHLDIDKEYRARELAELELVEMAAQLIVRLDTDPHSKAVFIDKAHQILDDYREKMKIGLFEIDELLALIKKVYIRAAKIKRVTTVKVKRKKKSVPDEPA